MITVGTPLWGGGFGCVTWVGKHLVGVAFLYEGEPSTRGVVPIAAAEGWAEHFRHVLTQDGRIETVVE